MKLDGAVVMDAGDTGFDVSQLSVCKLSRLPI